MDPDIRWQQRFSNYRAALGLLQECRSRDLDAWSLLEKAGIIQRFEVVVELGWKVLKDYLEFQQLALPSVTPRSVIKEAFAARIIGDGDAWIAMLGLRNELSHRYDEASFRRALVEIRERHLPALEELDQWLKSRMPN